MSDLQVCGMWQCVYLNKRSPATNNTLNVIHPDFPDKNVKIPQMQDSIINSLSIKSFL